MPKINWKINYWDKPNKQITKLPDDNIGWLMEKFRDFTSQDWYSWGGAEIGTKICYDENFAYFLHPNGNDISAEALDGESFWGYNKSKRRWEED